LDDHDRSVVVVEYDQEYNEIDGITAIIQGRSLRGDVEGEGLFETVVQEFIVRTIVSIFKGCTLGASVVENGEEAGGPSMI